MFWASRWLTVEVYSPDDRVVSIFRQAATSSESSNFDALMECIGDYILNRR